MNEILTLREVAVWLRCHPMTVYRLAHQRKIPAFRVASEWRFARRDLELWMEQNTSPPRTSHRALNRTGPLFS